MIAKLEVNASDDGRAPAHLCACVCVGASRFCLLASMYVGICVIKSNEQYFVNIF